ncbi:MAG: hypothetical protein WBL20_06495 [Sphingobium sp.]|jgi:hypothetical protein|nr:MAG: hypothetical protein DI537_28290 [Stutzerimonas stutzeri]
MSDDADPGGGSDQGGPPRRLRPTIIGPVAGTRPRKRAGTVERVPGAENPLRPSPIAIPTVIPGVERKRIAVSAVDIERLSPGLSAEVAARAVRLVEGFVVEGARDRQVTMWGHAVQRDYADIVSRVLTLSQNDVMERVRGYVGRMITLLDAIDLEAVCGAGQSAGLFGRFFRSAGGRIDSSSELGAARLELDQLVRLTGEALEPLLTLKDALEEQSRRIDVVGKDIEATTLAAAFLSEYLAKDQPGLSRRFLERSMSLTQTLIQIRGSQPLRGSQVEQPLRLIAAIQDVVLVALPGWLGAITALTTASSAGRRLTPTETGELQHQLRTILQQLNT